MPKVLAISTDTRYDDTADRLIISVSVAVRPVSGDGPGTARQFGVDVPILGTENATQINTAVTNKIISEGAARGITIATGDITTNKFV